MGMSSLRKLYAPEFLVKDSLKCGEIPSTKEVYGRAVSIAGPSVAEFFLISLIMMADTVMVSSVGPQAIAAVGITIQPRFIVQAMILALNVGVTSITARRFGEQDHQGTVSCLKQSLLLSAVLSCILSGAAFACSRPLLRLAGAGTDTLDLAVGYFRILMIGLPANCISLTISAALRGIGHTRVPMVINMTANVVNVCFNYLLIGGRLGFPALGVDGAAIATAIGWTVGLILAMVSVVHPSQYFFLLERGGWALERRTLNALYRVSSGAFLEQISMRIGFFIYNRMVAGLGTMQYAAHLICINISSLSFAVGEGMSLAAAAFVGQNLGARRPDLSVVYGKACQRIAVVYGVFLMLLLSTAGRFLVLPFSRDPEIIAYCKPLLIMMGVLVLGQASQMIFMGSLRGAGDTMYTAVVCTVSILLVRPVVAYFLIYHLNLGLVGAWSSFLLDQYMRLLFTYLRFTSGKWISIKL